MKPIKFKEQTGFLYRPSSMLEKQCGDLPIHHTGEQYISCWKMSFKERLRALFYGKIWLRVKGQISQPPVALDCDKTIFEKEKKSE